MAGFFQKPAEQMEHSLDITEQAAQVKPLAPWPTTPNDILDWLINGTSQEPFIDHLLKGLCERIAAYGLPLARSSMHFRTHHPEWLGARLLWETGFDEVQIDMFGRDMLRSGQYIKSPVNEILDGADELRKKLDKEIENGGWHDFYHELKQQGITDYVAWPVIHTRGKRHVVTFATKQQGGFSPEHIVFLKDLLPVLSMVTEIRVKNIMARTFLETYVGPHASEQILAGAITRGSGATMSAAIMICDLRGFTEISDLWPRDDVIEMLNGYFDALSEPVENHGGEILKFMGDGLLAVFPMDNENACHNLLEAIREGQKGMERLNAENQRRDKPNLRYGVGVHVGDVMYGNIGSKRRLDFTAIGPAVNIASRLESLTKEVGHSVLFSKEFAKKSGHWKELKPLGSFMLRGLGEPFEVYAMPEES